MTDPESRVGRDSLPAQSDGKDSCLLGLILSLSLPFVLLFFSNLIPGELAALPLMVIGLSQLVYIVPLVISFRKKQEPRTVQGLLIGAGVVFLLNAACFGLLATAF